MSENPAIYEEIPKHPLWSQQLYHQNKNYKVIKHLKQPVTPLGNNWNFQGCVLPVKYLKYAERYKNFQVREDDIWVVTFPKSGTTWAVEMTWLLMNNFDYETANNEHVAFRAPFLEINSLVTGEISYDTVDQGNKKASPRVIKSHLPISLLPDQLWTVKPKIIYVARNPADTSVSFFHHQRGLDSYQGEINNFAQLFMDGIVEHGPYQNHVTEFWKIRNEKNILFLTYEEMKKNLPAVMKKTCQFLGKTISEAEIKRMEHHLSFDRMKTKSERHIPPERLESMFRFYRKGKVGASKEELSPETLDKFSKWTKQQVGEIYPDF